MAHYMIKMIYPDGQEGMEDEVFDSEEDAYEYGLYLVSCSLTGAETLNLSNPGDYPLDDYEDPKFEVIEIDE